MLGATSKYLGDSIMNETGLIANHSYTVLAFYTLSNGVRLIKMRNVWGQDYYTGPWSDKGELWTEEIMNEVGGHVMDTDDSIFFISLENYFEQMDRTYISFDSTDWFSASFLKLDDDSVDENPGRWSFCGSECTRHELTLASDTTQMIYLTMNTWQSRCTPEECGNNPKHYIHR